MCVRMLIMKSMSTVPLIFVVFVFIFLNIHTVLASTTNGTISPNNYVWGENFGWINFGCANCTVQVTDSAVTGDVWSAQYGWINLSPTNGGVTNDGNGNLSGVAWSSGLGWIPFSGVTINSSGVFLGIAGTQGSTAGRINFSCTNCSVVTDWRPVSVRNGQTGGSSGSTGGSSSGGGSSGTILGGNSSVAYATTSTSSSTTDFNNGIANKIPQVTPVSQQVRTAPISQDILEGTQGWAYTTSSSSHMAKGGIVTFGNTASSSLFSKIELHNSSTTTIYTVSISILIIVLLALYILRSNMI